MNKHGFTLVELLATIVIIGILSTVAVVGTTKYLEYTRNKTYDSYVETLENATKNYLEDNTSEIPEVGSTKVITATTLYDAGYLENIMDPNKKSVSCITYRTQNMPVSSKVTVKRISNENNIDLEYSVWLYCPSKTFGNPY